MRQSLSVLVIITSVLLLVSGCATTRPSGLPQQGPMAEREFRGVWVATVGNIDWPSKPGLSTEVQKKEALAILDTVVALHMNAVVFQVRPHCDAMYDSKLEPWSSYLTGQQGKAPDPYYDPLTFWVEEAHKRGLELHAWFNPYRALMGRGGEPSELSVVKKHPELVKKLGNGTLWLDPSRKEVQDISYNVIMDVVHRYDVDGVHFDDYFYPYESPFPDDDSWAAYQKSGGSLSREDWRRDAVNTLVHRVYEGIKKDKPYVKFGISPFGIWRPGYPPSISGFDQYNNLFADARMWLNKGWVDYWTPQLYWAVNQIPQSFPVLLGWWTKENFQGRNIWPGMIIGRASSAQGADETINQIMIERGFVQDGPGHVHFSMKAFMRDSSVLNAALKAGPYQKMSLVPPSPWLDNKAPAAPKLDSHVTNDAIALSWTHENPGDVFRWVVYYKYGKNWEYTILNRDDKGFTVPLSRTVQDRAPRARRGETAQAPPPRVENLSDVAVSAVDRVGNESEMVFKSLAPQTAQAGK